MEVWLWIKSDHNVGGGGAEIKAYSSVERAIAANPGRWELMDDGETWQRQDAAHYEPETIERFQLD